MNERDYAKHKKALVARALMLSEHGLQLYVVEEYNKPQPDDMMFDVLTTALSKKMGKRRYDAWLATIPTQGEAK